MEDIRKLSVGRNYPDGAIHYQVGKEMFLQRVPYTIVEIVINDELLKEGKLGYDILIANNFGKVLWKTIVDLPVMVEYNINFE